MSGKIMHSGVNLRFFGSGSRGTWRLCVCVCGVGWVVSRVDRMTQTWWEIFWDGFLKKWFLTCCGSKALLGAVHWSIHQVTERQFLVSQILFYTISLFLYYFSLSTSNGIYQNSYMKDKEIVYVNDYRLL